MADYYVDNLSGDNGNDGSIGSPWKTRHPRKTQGRIVSNDDVLL
ncbi:MAG: hypothetical protein ACYTDW_20880 [Planctomycetota bacterium]